MTSPRHPNIYDYIAFYAGIPLLFGIIAAPFAIPPQGSVDFAVIAYVCFRAIIFWIIIDFACRCIGHSLARYKLPLWSIFTGGFALAGTTIYVFFFVAIQTTRFKNPDIAALIGHENMGWNLDYVLIVAGYALPALILWFVSAFGYMRAFNVRLFSYAHGTGYREDDSEKMRFAGPETRHPDERIPAFLSESRLPKSSRVMAIKAEEHYIRVWTEKGTDLLRYRFKDAINELSEKNGLQVHRSWWVCLSSIDQVRTRGRTIELQLKCDDLIVPVSLSYKQALLHALKMQQNPLNFQADSNKAS